MIKRISCLSIKLKIFLSLISIPFLFITGFFLFSTFTFLSLNLELGRNIINAPKNKVELTEQLVCENSDYIKQVWYIFDENVTVNQNMIYLPENHENYIYLKDFKNYKPIQEDINSDIFVQSKKLSTIFDDSTIVFTKTDDLLKLEIIMNKNHEYVLNVEYCLKNKSFEERYPEYEKEYIIIQSVYQKSPFTKFESYY